MQLNNNQLTIFYVADFNCPSGYSKAAKDYVLALDSIGVNVIPVFPTSTWDGKDIDEEVLAKLKEMASRKPTKYQMAIEHFVPELMSDRPNIGFIAWETTHLPENWPKLLNRKKAIFTCSVFSRDAMLRSGVTVPVFVIPHIVAPKQEKARLDLAGKREKNFLVVGEFSERKAIEETVTAFLIATNGREDTSLTLKCSSFNPTKTGMKIKQMVERCHDNAKTALGDSFKSFSPVLLCDKILQDQFMPEFYLNSTHFITASRGEAFNLPLAEAMSYGLTTICPAEGGHMLYATDKTNILMGGQWVKAGGVEGNGRYDNAGGWYDVNTETIVDAITYALNKDTKQEAKLGQETVVKQLSPLKMATLLTNLTKQVMNPVSILAGPPTIPDAPVGRPMVVKCVQALNEEKLIQPCLRNCYNEVDLILVVEGGAQGRKDAQGGHSIDSTHQKIMEFIEKEDVQKKVIYFTKPHGFKDYEDIKNVFAEFFNRSLANVKDKVCFIADADEFMLPEHLNDCIQEFVKNPEISEVVPKFLHFWKYIDVIDRPIPSEMNIQHQRLTRWPQAGGWYYSHPTITDLSNGLDTACHPDYQSRRLVVDKYIYHVGGLKPLEFFRMKHDYYTKNIKAYINQGMEYKLKDIMRLDKFLYYSGPIPEELYQIGDLEYLTDMVSFPDWKTSKAYSGEIKCVPLFTIMEDKEFIIPSDGIRGYKELKN